MDTADSMVESSTALEVSTLLACIFFAMDANFLLTRGNRVMIKRKLFEEYLHAASVI